MRSLALLAILASGCSSSIPTREVPLTPEERRAVVATLRRIEDMQTDLVAALIQRHGLDPRSVLDPSRGVLIAPVESGS